jgi:GNAT superfamily N-acetyltransferase
MPAGTRYGVEVRAALPADTADVAALLGQAGYPAAPHDIAERLDGLRGARDSALLVAAGYGGMIGLVAVHWYATLQDARPVARITALVVDEAERRRGIGRLLVKAGAQAARVAGCDALEVAATPGVGAAEAFWAAIGFAPAASLLARSLRKRSAGS